MALKAKKKKKRKVKSMFFPKLILGAFVIYSVVTIISLFVQIDAQEEVVTRLEGEITQEGMKQEQLTQLMGEELDEEYIISEAQKNGYAASNERVFKDVAGQ